jgi:serine/threonine-protein kinase SRPK3
VLLKKLGIGTYASCWLARDCLMDIFVSIKIHKSAPYYLESAFDECEMLQLTNKRVADREWNRKVAEHFPDEVIENEGFVVNLLNSFVHFGPNGNHFCMVLELLGPSLAQIMAKIDKDKLSPKIYERVTKQTLLGLHFLHDYCSIIHTDIKAENVLLSLPLEETERIIAEEVEHTKIITSKSVLELREKLKLGEFAKAEEDSAKAPGNLTKKQKKQLKKKQKKKYFLIKN